jgi:hypothetical protein
MAKLTNVRERVHQPFYDSLCRYSGWGFGANQQQVNDRNDLFVVAGKPGGESNMRNGSVLPSDQSHVTLALRVFLWFKSPVARGAAGPPLTRNGDYDPALVAAFFGVGGAGAGNAPADYHDVHRNYFQAMEQLHWSYGTGEKFSIQNMASKYFPDGGGLHGDIGGTTDLIHWNNGDPSHTAILRLARAILMPPRQNMRCEAVIFRYDPVNAAAIGVVQGGRDMLNLRDNLNAVDGMNKIVQFSADGLFARDVQ